MTTIGEPEAVNPKTSRRLRDHFMTKDQQISAVPSSRTRNQSASSALTISLLKEQTGVTDDQLNQTIPEDSLFDIAVLIPNWSDYAGSQGMELSAGDIQSVREDSSLTRNRMKVQRCLELWRSEHSDEATYRRVLRMCLKRKDGDVAMKIVNEVILGTDEVDVPVPSPTVAIATSTDPPAIGLYKHADSQEKLQNSVGNNLDEEHLASKTLTLVKNDFAVLYSSVRRELKKEGVTASDLLSHLRDMETLGPETEPVLTNHNTTLGTVITTVKRGPTVDDVFHLMAPYSSWFNHLLIESIIKVFFEDSHSIHGKFHKFKSKFKEYCQARHFPMVGFGSNVTDGTISVVFKVDYHWENIQVGQLVNVQLALADALSINRTNLLLRTVKNGCLELTVAMPTHIAQEFSPLPEKLISPLQDSKAISFKYDYYTCNISRAAQEIKQSQAFARQVAERLHLIGDSLDAQLTVGEVVGAAYANIGERALPTFFEPPKEPEANVYINSYTGPLIQYMCYLVPGIIPLSNRQRIMAGLFGSLCSAGLIYYRWQKYPHNIAVKHRAAVDMYSTVGALIGNLVCVQLGVSVETGNVFVFLGSFLVPFVFKFSRFLYTV